MLFRVAAPRICAGVLLIGASAFAQPRRGPSAADPPPGYGPSMIDGPTSGSAPRAPAPTAPPAPQYSTTPPAPPAPTPPRRYWYGWQTLIADAVALGVASAADPRNGRREGLLYTGAVLYVLGGPFVHFMQEEPGKALGSAGLRIGAPLAGALALGGPGFANSREPDETANYGAILGFSLGIAAAVATDAAALARKAPPNSRVPRVQVAPFATRDALGVDLTGSF